MGNIDFTLSRIATVIEWERRGTAFFQSSNINFEMSPREVLFMKDFHLNTAEKRARQCYRVVERMFCHVEDVQTANYGRTLGGAMLDSTLGDQYTLRQTGELNCTDSRWRTVPSP